MQKQHVKHVWMVFIWITIHVKHVLPIKISLDVHQPQYPHNVNIDLQLQHNKLPLVLLSPIKTISIYLHKPQIMSNHIHVSKMNSIVKKLRILMVIVNHVITQIIQLPISSDLSKPQLIMLINMNVNSPPQLLDVPSMKEPQIKNPPNVKHVAQVLMPL